jgi:hypothetical protein
MTEQTRRIQRDVERHFGRDSALAYWRFAELACGVRMHLVDHEQVTLTEAELEFIGRLRQHLGLSAGDVGPGHVRLVAYGAENARRNLATVMTRDDLVAFDEMEAAVAKAVEEKLDQRLPKNLVGRVAREFNDLRPMETVADQEEAARRAVARCFEEVVALSVGWRPSIVYRYGETRHERFEEALPGLLSAMAGEMGVTIGDKDQSDRP